MGEAQPQYPYPYRTDAQGNPVYATAAESDASTTPSTPTAYARSFGTYSTSPWDRSAYGDVREPATASAMPPPIAIMSSPQTLSPVSSPSHQQRRHPRRSATLDSSPSAARPRPPRRRSTRGPYPDSSQPPRPLRPILPAPPSPLIASEQTSYGAHALAAPASSRSAYPHLPPTPVYNWGAAPVAPMSLGSVPASPVRMPGYSGGGSHLMPSDGNYETPNALPGQCSSPSQGFQGSTADAVDEFGNSGASATPDVNDNRLPLTFSNLAIWNGEGQEFDNEPPSQDLITTAPPATVSAQQIVARQTLAASALAFIDDFKWMSEAERHYLKELITHTPQWLKDSSRTPGQVGSLFTTVHSDGPEQRYRWRFSDVPGSTDQLVSDLPDGPEKLGTDPRERWVRHAALHHAAVAIITFSVSCLEAMPADCDLHSWVHSSLAQITEQAGRVTQAIKAEMQGWSQLRASSEDPLKVESRAWWFGSEFNDPTWRGTGNRPAWVVTGSTGRTQESMPHAADRIALTRR